MSKFIVRKAYRGLEGPVRVGQVLDAAKFPTLTKERAAELERGGMLAPYSYKMKAQARNQAYAGPRDPGRMVSPNAGGLTELGWDPEKGDGSEAGTLTTGNAVEGAEGNGQGAESTGAPNGSSTSTDATSSSSPAAQAPPAPTSSGPAPGRRQRGTRPSS